ncbi:unnamed protein product [Mycena citricolor]|uniref:FAD dependent oxidoreductase domain-containing protein n=1 Tax=Mycena citricolor TaxID=2018698 RepID=A0AAD2HW93_9AGAR|nr:unnamed protein product [Mycena citricolor]
MGVSSAVPLGQMSSSQSSFDTPKTGRPTLPVPHPTRSFWIDSPGANPLASRGSDGPLTSDTDICIIGSGITGVSAAYHLSRAVQAGELRKDVKVTILEARDFCSGATGRNGGHLTSAVFLEFCDYAAKYESEEAMRSFEMENRTQSEIVSLIRTQGWAEAVDLVEGGHTTVFFTPEEERSVNADYEAAKASGLALREIVWLTAEEMERTYGVSYPGVHFSGFNLWPLKLVTKLFLLAEEHLQLSIHTRTPALSIGESPSENRRWQIGTPRGVVHCSHIIHATNAYASNLLPQLAGPGGIVPTRGQVAAIRASVDAPALTKCSWDGNEGFEYWFPRPVTDPTEKPVVILGGGREVSEDFEFYNADDSTVDSRVGLALRKFLPAAFPGKYEGEGGPEMEWTGIMGFTRLRDPFVGPLSQHEGQYISAGYSGHGMPRAYSCAEVVALMIVAELAGKEWHAPQWFPEAFLTTRRGL